MYMCLIHDYKSNFVVFNALIDMYSKYVRIHKNGFSKKCPSIFMQNMEEYTRIENYLIR